MHNELSGKIILYFKMCDLNKSQPNYSFNIVVVIITVVAVYVGLTLSPMPFRILRLPFSLEGGGEFLAKNAQKRSKMSPQNLS